MKIKSPCYKCEKREPGCHGWCPEGIAADEAHKKAVETIRQGREMNGYSQAKTTKILRRKKKHEMR